MTTNQLANQLDSYLKRPERTKGYVAVPKRLMLQIQAHLKLMELLSVQSPQPAPQTEHIGLAVSVPVES